MEQFTVPAQAGLMVRRILRTVLAAVLAAAMVLSLGGCASSGLTDQQQKQLKADIVESTEHAMIINEFMCYMFDVDEGTDPATLGDTSQFNNTVRLLKLNNYLEYADHIDLVKDERNKIVEAYDAAKGNAPEDIKKMYDNYILVTDLAFDPQNDEDTLEAFVTEYKEIYDKAQEIYELGK